MSRPPRIDTVQAVILDWAGTAVDFGCLGPVAVFIEAFARRGVTVTAAEARAPMGLKKRDHIVAMCAQEDLRRRWLEAHGTPPGETDIDEMYAFTEPRMIETVREHSAPIPGVVEFIAELRAKGVRIGSTTGYTRSIMDVVEERARTAGYAPDCVVASDEVPAGRPAPFMCYAAALRLGAYPFSAMVKIGDTVADVGEGRNAGMWTVGVTLTGNELGLSPAEVAALPEAERRERLGAVENKLRAAGAHYVVETAAEAAAVLPDIERRLRAGESPIHQLLFT